MQDGLDQRACGAGAFLELLARVGHSAHDHVVGEPGVPGAVRDVAVRRIVRLFHHHAEVQVGEVVVAPRTLEPKAQMRASGMRSRTRVAKSWRAFWLLGSIALAALVGLTIG